MRPLRALPLAIASLLTSLGAVLAQGSFSGRWHDNVPGLNALGPLTISTEKIAVGRKVTYQVRSAGPFGDGELFEVTAIDRKVDPVCDTHFIVVQPSTAAVGGTAILVSFYSGSSAPKPQSIADDTAVCHIHPFSR